MLSSLKTVCNVGQALGRVSVNVLDLQGDNSDVRRCHFWQHHLCYNVSLCIFSQSRVKAQAIYYKAPNLLLQDRENFFILPDKLLILSSIICDSAWDR